MLRAIYQQESVYAHVVSQKKARDLKEFRCPGCRQLVYLKSGPIKQPHFSHYAKAACPYGRTGETHAHLAGKMWLYQALRSKQDVELEVYLPAIQQRPDILVKKQLVLEIQCSRLTDQRCQERVKGYHQEQLEVHWLVGADLWRKGQRLLASWPFIQLLTPGVFYILEIESSRKHLSAVLFAEDGQVLLRICLNPQQIVLRPAQLKDYLKQQARTRLKLTSGGLTSTRRNQEGAARRRWQQALYFKHPQALRVQAYFYQQRRSLAQLPSFYFERSSHLFYAREESLIWHDGWFRLLKTWQKKADIRSLKMLVDDFYQHLKQAQCRVPHSCYLSCTQWLEQYLLCWLILGEKQSILQEIRPGEWRPFVLPENRPHFQKNEAFQPK